MFRALEIAASAKLQWGFAVESLNLKCISAVGLRIPCLSRILCSAFERDRASRLGDTL